jgi:Ca2+-transporting ATPase
MALPCLCGFEFEFLGLLALTDPIRSEVPVAVEQCHGAGIRLLMITGDLPETAMSIARQAGLLRGNATMTCITGAQASTLDDAGLRQALSGCHVIARATPDLKLRVIKALQASGEVVAMTGDGVNDAPALRAADIGIAMGGRGTDVAREAADIVVTDDRFSSIVAGIRLGRRIYANLTEACGYVVAIHIPIAGLSVLPLLSGETLMLLPIHIAFLELMIDPACSVAFEAEPEAPDTMQKPPRDRRAGLFGLAGVRPWVIQGLAMLAAVALMHEWARREFADPDVVRTLSFGMLVMSNLSLLISRGWRLRNPTMWTMMAIIASGLALILSWAWMRDIFHLGAVPGWSAGSICLLAMVLVPCLAVVRQRAKPLQA